MSASTLILLERFFDPGAAHVVKTFLEDKGISAFLFDENMSSVDWTAQIAIGGIRLMVLQKDYDEAKKLLSGVSPPEKKETPFLPAREKRIDAFVSLLLFFLTGLFPGRNKRIEGESHE